MSFCQTRKRSAQSSKVERRVAGISWTPCAYKHFSSKHCYEYTSCRVGSRQNLASLEFWLALFHKCANSFLAILGIKTLQLVLHFTFQSNMQSLLASRKYRLLHVANHNLRAIGDLLGVSIGFRFQLRQRINVIHESHAMRRLGVNHFPGIKHL